VINEEIILDTQTQHWYKAFLIGFKLFLTLKHQNANGLKSISHKLNVPVPGIPWLSFNESSGGRKFTYAGTVILLYVLYVFRVTMSFKSTVNYNETVSVTQYRYRTISW
jgi:hypothetical protein